MPAHNHGRSKIAALAVTCAAILTLSSGALTAAGTVTGSAAGTRTSAITSPAALATTSAAMATEKSEKQPVLMAEITAVQPRIYPGSGELEFNLKLKNTSDAFLSGPAISLYSTRAAVNMKADWEDWVRYPEKTNLKDSRTLLWVKLPEMFAYQEINVKLSVNPQLAHRYLSNRGTYGITVEAESTAFSNSSTRAQNALEKLRIWQEQGSDLQKAPPQIQQRGRTFATSTTGPVDANVQTSANTILCDLVARTSTLLPIAASQNSPQVLPLAPIGYATSDFRETTPHEKPALHALTRTHAALQQAQELGITALFDPALTQLSDAKAPNPQQVRQLNQLNSNPENYYRGNTKPTQTPADSATQQNAASTETPSTAKSAEPTPEAAGPTPTPENEIGAELAAQQNALAPLFRLIRQAKPGSIAFLPWANPAWEDLKNAGDTGINLGAQSIFFTHSLAARAFSKKLGGSSTPNPPAQANNTKTPSTSAGTTSKTASSTVSYPAEAIEAEPSTNGTLELVPSLNGNPIVLPASSADLLPLENTPLSSNLPLLVLLQGEDKSATNGGIGQVQIAQQSRPALIENTLGSTLLEFAAGAGLRGSSYAAQQALLAVLSSELPPPTTPDLNPAVPVVTVMLPAQSSTWPRATKILQNVIEAAHGSQSNLAATYKSALNKVRESGAANSVPHHTDSATIGPSPREESNSTPAANAAAETGNTNHSTADPHSNVISHYDAVSLGRSLSHLNNVAAALVRPRLMLNQLQKSALLQFGRIDFGGPAEPSTGSSAPSTADSHTPGPQTPENPASPQSTRNPQQWIRDTEPYNIPLRADVPQSVLMIYGSSQMPVKFTNSLPWDAKLRATITAENPRLQPGAMVTAEVGGETTAAVSLPIEGVGSGDIEARVVFFTPNGKQIGASETTTVKVRADWESTGLAVIGTILAAILTFGIVRRIRKGRRVTAADIAQAEALKL